MFIQKNLFHYFKTNLVHYFFLLSNEHLSRCIINYFCTNIYSCTYSNINYYYSKYIKNIFHFKFITLVNLIKLLIINYGEVFTLYKEISNSLFYYKIKDVLNVIKFIQKRNYIVDTSYVLSNYITTELVHDNIFSNFLYKSLFYKKKLSLYVKKSYFDNIIDIMYLYGVSQAHDLFKRNHHNDDHNDHHNDHNKEDNMDNSYYHNNYDYHYVYHYDDDKNEYKKDKSKNICYHINDLIKCINNSYIEQEQDEENNKDTYHISMDDYYDNYFNDNSLLNEHVNNSEDDYTHSNMVCEKYYFYKKLNIFQVNYYIKNFLSGNIILYACNNYIISDDEKK